MRDFLQKSERHYALSVNYGKKVICCCRRRAIDRLGAQLAIELRRLHPNIEIEGVFGVK